MPGTEAPSPAPVADGAASRPHGRARRFVAGHAGDLLFAAGSVCFAAASIASQWASAPRPWIGVTFFVGSVFFTGGGGVQVRDAARAGGPSRDLASALVQLAGTLFFNVSTFRALQHGLSAGETDRRVWAPDVLGSICFLVSSGMAYGAARGRIATLNLIGSIAFGVSAIASVIEPSTSEPLSAAVANATTTLGALCFLAGAVLPLRRARPAARSASRPDTDRERLLRSEQ